jgi:rRNA maturation RNase YbeY
MLAELFNDKNNTTNISFNFLKPITLKERNRLKNNIKSIFKNEGKSLNSLSIIFCSDKYLLNINKEFLHHNYYTDIITFDLSTSNKLIDAEIYISIERVKENAKAFNSSIKTELHRVIFHGVLHLCGYKDKSHSQKTTMRQKEDQSLKNYFV